MREDHSTTAILMRILHEEKTERGEHVNLRTLPFSRIARVIDTFKNNCLFPHSLLKKQHSKFDKAVFTNVYPGYQERLKQHNAVDFGDLIQHVIQLFKHHKEIKA